MSETKKYIPSIDYLLKHKALKELTHLKSHYCSKTLIKEFVDIYKQQHGNLMISQTDFIAQLINYIQKKTQNPFKKLINATGVILHTNLGRAPISETVYDKCKAFICNYTNLEFNLDNGQRGDRNNHLNDIIKLITGAEDVLIVNNNAAAVYLCLNHFAKNKEVLISRSELIEIGGSFRIPDIMQSSGAILKEIGTTNCTRISDYTQHLNENTGLIFKAHQSNYHIIGHTESVEIEELSSLSCLSDIPFFYDIGSGLINKPETLNSYSEPSVFEAIQKGADLVSFSADKLLGGPQAGIIIGKKKYIQQLAKNPLMRVLRADKLSLSILYECFALYLDDEKLIKDNPVLHFLNRPPSVSKSIALRLAKLLKQKNVETSIHKSFGKTGGGTMPNLQLESFALEINCKNLKAEDVYLNLMQGDTPIISILKEGKLFLDTLCLFEKDLRLICLKIAQELMP